MQVRIQKVSANDICTAKIGRSGGLVVDHILQRQANDRICDRSGFICSYDGIFGKKEALGILV
jgi:hypothetical protein